MKGFQGVPILVACSKLGTFTVLLILAVLPRNFLDPSYLQKYNHGILFTPKKILVLTYDATFSIL